MLLGLVIILMCINWALETIKWKRLINQVIKIDYAVALKNVLTGITLSIITPNRIGEIPGRVYLTNKKERFKEMVYLTSVGAYAQLIATVLFGVIGVFISRKYFSEIIPDKVLVYLTTASLFILLGYFLLRKIQRLFKRVIEITDGLNRRLLLETLLLSFVRFFVFSLQYFLVLKAFSIELGKLEEVFLIPVCFLFSSVIPTMILSEIGVRSSVALLVFGVVSNNPANIVAASVVLWLINVAFPAILGILFLDRFKLRA